MASRLHKRTLRLLKEILGTSIKEEVNVQDLFSEYPARNEHYDLVIPSYNLVVECHGEQHKTPSSFGEKNFEKVVTNFQRQQRRDRMKEEIVWENEWGYVVVWYNELPKEDKEAKIVLKKKVLEAINRIDKE
jgi:G:T-mismatch repair DNA endonuclease (very short patch repair protein)